jgi:hypothetical protein
MTYGSLRGIVLALFALSTTIPVYASGPDSPPPELQAADESYDQGASEMH